MAQARTQFLNHKVMRTRLRILYAFFTINTATDGTKFIAPSFNRGGTTYTIWKSTLGTIVQANKDGLTSPAKELEFMNAVLAHAMDPSKRLTPMTGTWKLSVQDSDALYQIVEMLSLINEARAGE
jgi:hypothetical protein